MRTDAGTTRLTEETGRILITITAFSREIMLLPTRIALQSFGPPHCSNSAGNTRCLRYKQVKTRYVDNELDRCDRLSCKVAIAIVRTRV